MAEMLTELGVNWQTLLTQIISFGILFFILRMVAYRPLMRILDERSRRVSESMEQAEVVEKKAAEAEAETKKQFEAAGREVQERLAKAKQVGEDLRQQAELEARKEAEKILERARTEIQHERDEAIGEIRKEFGELTVMAAEKVIDRSLDRQSHRDIIEKVLEEGASLKDGNK